jgi:hypothetical protein
LDLIRVIESDKDLAPTEQVSDGFPFPALAAMLEMSAFPRLRLRSARLGIAEVRQPGNAASYLSDIAA